MKKTLTVIQFEILKSLGALGKLTTRDVYKELVKQHVEVKSCEAVSKEIYNLRGLKLVITSDGKSNNAHSLTAAGAEALSNGYVKEPKPRTSPDDPTAEVSDSAAPTDEPSDSIALPVKTYPLSVLQEADIDPTLPDPEMTLIEGIKLIRQAFEDQKPIELPHKAATLEMLESLNATGLNLFSPDKIELLKNLTHVVEKLPEAL